MVERVGRDTVVKEVIKCVLTGIGNQASVTSVTIRRETRRAHSTVGANHLVNDRNGKVFITLRSNGDLPTNPMSLRECMVCGDVFTHDESREHSEVACQPWPQQPLAGAGRYR